MIRKYSLIIEGDDAGYSGYVPELPTILVTGKSMEELTACAKEAVRLYWETQQTESRTIEAGGRSGDLHGKGVSAKWPRFGPLPLPSRLP